MAEIQRFQIKTLLSILGNRRCFLLKTACFLLITFLLILSIHSSIYVKVFRVTRHRSSSQPIPVADFAEHFSLILDTPGCKIPKLDPYDKSVRSLIVTRKQPYVCHGDPVFLGTGPNNTVVLNEQILRIGYNVSANNINCSYQVISRAKEPDGNTSEKKVVFGASRRLQFSVPLNEEFIKICCEFLGSLKRRPYRQYLPLVPIKPEVEQRNLKVEVKREHETDSLNVILIGIDSVSKLNFLRQFRRTHRFLTEKVQAFEMKGYTKVGDNTFPNLVPLLTGHFIEHYWNESVNKKVFFDGLDFIWNDYAKRGGYRTFYAEDNPPTGTFNYLKNGFRRPPTDYYFRTIGLAIHQSELRKEGKEYCLNDQLETEILYNYTRDFVRAMGPRPYFAFTMVSTLTHDYLNSAGYCDLPTYNLLKGLWEDGVMNRSAIIIFSDHGIRFGNIRMTYVGKIEERMPFMYIILPRWFLEKHPVAWKNLQTNQNRLITLFDVHATLHHLLDIGVGKPPVLNTTFTPKGLSLLGPVSENRTCADAHILPHWCCCHVYREVPINDSHAIAAAENIVSTINKMLSKFVEKCARLKVDRILDARVRQASDDVLRFVKHQNDVVNRRVVYGNKTEDVDEDFLVTLRTFPGGAAFEGTVRHKVKFGELTVLEISRINAYGNQSWCIDVPALKKFCYCK